MENFWSLFNLALKGTYVSVDASHLNAYVTEKLFRFNEGTDNDGGRYRKLLGSAPGKRITYEELIARV